MVEIQSNQEYSKVETDASVAAFCEHLSHARSMFLGMMPVTKPTAMREDLRIRRMLFGTRARVGPNSTPRS